jgi:hypothetical protein
MRIPCKLLSLACLTLSVIAGPARLTTVAQIEADLYNIQKAVNTLNTDTKTFDGTLPRALVRMDVNLRARSQ